jgi:fibronectin-binding autotransporter adhesin
LAAASPAARSPPTATRVIGNAISVATGTTSGLIDGGAGDLHYTGAATGDGNLATNSTTSRSMWLQGDWSGFTGQITFTVNGGGTNYRLGGTPGATTSNNGTNGSDFSQTTFILSGSGGDRGLSWNGAQGATVRVGTFSGTGGRIITGASGRDANWEVGGRVVNVAGSLSMVDSEYVQTYNLTGGSIAAPPSGVGYLRAAASGLFINSLPAATSSQITGRIDLTFASGTLDVADGAAADDLVISAAILQNTGGGSGAKSITKTGAGTLLLSGTNSYAGGTFIDAGLVKAGSSRALGAENAAASTVTIAAGATLDINRVTGNTGDFFYGMTIAGAGTAGQGALINTGANGGTGLRQTPNITLSADATIGGSGNILMIDTGYAANSLDLAGNTLTKTGTNTLFMANTTVSAGTIAIQQGTLSHFNTAANAAAAAITLADAAGATLALNNFGLQVGSLAGGGATGGNVTLGSSTLTLGGRNEDTSFGGSISGTGAVVKTGTGTQTFAAASSYSGGTTISGGTLVAGNANAFGTSGAISVGASGTLGVGDDVTFTRPFTLTAGGRVRTGNNSTVGLPSVAALAAWESQSGTGDETLAEILDASGSTTPTALFSAWTANAGTYFSDILTLEGTGAGNTYVLSMGYNEFASGNLNIWYRENVADPFVPLGTSFAGNVPWTSAFTTPGQYGVDTSAGTVWAVTDHNSQFVIVPEPGTIGLAAVGLSGGIWYLRCRRAACRP